METEREQIEEKTADSTINEQLELIEREIEPYEELNHITTSFLNDLECIKEMFEVVIPSLRQKDEARKARIEEIVEFFQHLTQKEKDERSEDNRTVVAAPIEEIRNLGKAVRKLNRANIMFRQNTILNLISRYDQFLSDVYSHNLRRNPGELKGSNKKLSYNEILELESIEEAIERFIAKEVDRWLRQPHIEKLEDLDSRLKLGIKDHLSSWDTFVEVVQRRNLFAHTGGRVNSQYIQTCMENRISIDTEVGEYLRVSEAYFERVYRCLFEIGIRIGQAALRRLYPDKIEYADGALNNIGYELLRAEQWRIAEIVFNFALEIPDKHVSSDEYYRMYLINECIATKQSGKKEKTENILDSVDWSATHPKFVLAVHVLKDEYEQAEKVMSSMSGKYPREDDFLTWPLFKDFRETEYFRRAFKRVYGKDYEIEVAKEVTEASETELLTDLPGDQLCDTVGSG